MRYRRGEIEIHACFPSYAVAKTAAIRAIFMPEASVDGICLLSDDGHAKARAYQTAVDWLKTIA